jgi:hypothetical protein
LRGELAVGLSGETAIQAGLEGEAMWYPDSASWKLARNAFAGDTGDARWNTDVMEIAVENAVHTEVLAGMPDVGPRILLRQVPWRRPLWLATFVDDADFDRENFLFTSRSAALEWAAERIPEAVEQFWDWDTSCPGWPAHPTNVT